MRQGFLHGLFGLLALAGTVPAAAAAPAPHFEVTASHGILQIIGDADPIVKGVMLLLLVASLATWTLAIMKSQELRKAKDCLRADIRTISGAATLEQARSARYPVTLEMIEVAAAELRRAGTRPSHRQIEGLEDRVSAQLPMVEARAMHRILWGTNILASIGAISPFVGLAGTVWGIMNSFLGISQAQSASLAVVAPGIAEALMATAIGLAAAIPAVLVYNYLSRSIAGYRRLLNEMAVLAACVLSRETESIEASEGAPRPRAVAPQPELVGAAQTGAR